MNKSIGNSVGIILQARMGSTRLPGKILLPLGYTTVLGWILDRLEQLPYKVVVATTENPQDDVVIKFCDNRSTFSFRGHEQNVLDRYYYSSAALGPDGRSAEVLGKSLKTDSQTIHSYLKNKGLNIPNNERYY